MWAKFAYAAKSVRAKAHAQNRTGDLNFSRSGAKHYHQLTCNGPLSQHSKALYTPRKFLPISASVR
eukprot:7102641-Prymnesium_polylepis.1